MRRVWWLLLVLLVACDLNRSGDDWNQLVAELDETATSAFFLQRNEPGLPAVLDDRTLAASRKEKLLTVGTDPSCWTADSVN